MQGQCRTFMDLTVTIERGSPSSSSSSSSSSSQGGGEDALAQLTSCCVEVGYGCYGPSGLTRHKQHIVLPLAFPSNADGGDGETAAAPKEVREGSTGAAGYSVHAIPTHLLHHGDDPLEVIDKYVKPHIAPGDILAVAETPLAIMQGRCVFCSLAGFWLKHLSHRKRPGKI